MTAGTTGGPYGQAGSGIRFDWGVAGATELGRVCAALVVVDVLSFSTSVTVAVGRGMRVHPFPWSEQAAAYAARIGGQVAVGRSQRSPETPWTLSPDALSTAPVVPDLVLPSPNGSAICAAAAGFGLPVVAGAVVNARAVARFLTAQGYGSAAAPIGVVAAGEHWPDGKLRPSVEDLLGAALIVGALVDTRGGDADLSVEAAVALAVLSGIPDVPAAIRGSVSGLELIGQGYETDVEIAVARDSSETVPVLRAGAFTPAPR